jgi:peptidoglycan L-alanyl-D-glutamate endopeptidase CwlK
MTFKLSQRSLDKMEGVDTRLVSVAKAAIGHTKTDFGVICGLRTIGEQREHIEGRALDLMAYVGSRGSWEIKLYDDIADAVKQAAIDVGVPVRWGAAWHINDIREWDGTMEDAYNAYVDLRRSQGKRPFIDGPHFELMV